ncbi:permease prefix domain 1-containing protein [Agrococcus sp. SL85]|uniref:permease prefix domain 1-containing protein n=1 Tax=Agrococcus sp. SL85 TaxID=2995141 RepID=UPI00226CBE67|nr:permease prefix domain 1-containing protein [Agrococcus sp. SL85]WAC65381.1 permease prefix domain 1-containing protein [Agrococcus sp. SL85]
MDPMPAADPVTDLVARLERGVVASRRRRRDAIAEVEGDLREAVAARVARGQAGPEAARAVVAEFGDPAAIAAELSRELLADLGRRYSPASAAGAGLLVVAWIAGMTTLAGMPGFRVPTDVAWMLPLSRALDVLAPVVVVAAAVGWLAIRRAGSIAALVAVAALQARPRGRARRRSRRDGRGAAGARRRAGRARGPRAAHGPRGLGDRRGGRGAARAVRGRAAQARAAPSTRVMIDAVAVHSSRSLASARSPEGVRR